MLALRPSRPLRFKLFIGTGVVMNIKNASYSFKKGLTRNVVFLGIVSGLTDISSEMLYPLVPIFLREVLHSPMSVIGLIEGIAESTASILKAAGGLWSDRISRRKPFIVWGYGLSSVSKPLLALAATWHLVLFSRFLDRVGKGIRTSARDALVASSTPKEHWGKAFGFHRAMDTMGAALGPLAALFFLNILHISYRSIFIIAFIPALLGVIVLIAFVKEQGANTGAKDGGNSFSPLKPAAATFRPPLSPDFKKLLTFYCIFALGNSSDAFLILKAKSIGFTTAHVILAYVGYNVVYALCAAPAGWLSDKLGRAKTLSFGLIIFAVVYSGFAMASQQYLIWILFAVYGFYGATTEGIAKALIADCSVPENRGTAMGVFQGATGMLAFAASSAAGLLWTHFSSSAPFIMGAVCASVASFLFLTVKNRTTEPLNEH